MTRPSGEQSRIKTPEKNGSYLVGVFVGMATTALIFLGGGFVLMAWVNSSIKDGNAGTMAELMSMRRSLRETHMALIEHAASTDSKVQLVIDAIREEIRRDKEKTDP